MRNLLFLALTASSMAMAADSSEPASFPDSLKFTPVEFYSFELGGESGQYTAWEKQQISKFDGLSATIDIQEVRRV